MQDRTAQRKQTGTGTATDTALQTRAPAHGATTGPGAADSRLAPLRDMLDRSPAVRALSGLQQRLNPPATPPVQRAANRTGLPDGLKSGLESLSGLSMDSVRVHYNSGRPANLQAHAYTQGNQIHVAPGQERHLPHEGWHAVQQMQGRVRSTTQLAGIGVNDESALEREAETMGARALTRGAAPGLSTTTPQPRAGVPAATAPVQGYFRYNADRQWMVDLDSNTLYLLDGKPLEDGTVNLVSFTGRETVVPTPFDGIYRRPTEPEPEKRPGPDLAPDDDHDATKPEEGGLDEEPEMAFVKGETAERHTADTRLRTGGPSLYSGFTVHAVLAPIDQGQLVERGGEADVVYDARQVFVEEMRVGNNDRPDTRFGSRQERHTVAWTLERAAQLALAGRDLRSVLTLYINEMGELIGRDQSEETIKLLESVLVAAEPLLNARLPIDVWQSQLCRVAELYTQAYQSSAAATFKQGRAVGHGEADAMAILSAAEEDIDSLGGNDGKVLALAAAKLLDVSFNLSLGTTNYGYAVAHWIQNLNRAFPALMAKHGDALVANILDKELTAKLKEETGVDNVRGLVAALDEDLSLHASGHSFTHGVTLRAGGSQGLLRVAVPDSLDADFVANIRLYPVATGAPDEQQVQTTQEEQARSIRRLTYRADQLELADIRVSDRDRPKTRFKTQMSHTVAWTLVRTYLRSFSGGSAEHLVQGLGAHLMRAVDDLQNGDALRLAIESLEQLRTLRQAELPIHQWQAVLSDAIRRYAIVYQQLGSATYADDRTHGQALGHGESSNMELLRRNEFNLEETGRLADEPDEVAAAALALLDARINTSLNEQQYLAALAHWYEVMQQSFPNVFRTGRSRIDQKLLEERHVNEAKKHFKTDDFSAILEHAQRKAEVKGALFDKVTSSHQPQQQDQNPLTLLAGLGFTRHAMPGTGNDCAIASIYDQLTTRHGFDMGNAGQFAAFVRHHANLAMGSMIDVLNNGPALLAAVQEWINARSQATLNVNYPAGLVLNVWSAVPGNGLMQFNAVARHGGNPAAVLTLYFNGTNHFDSLTGTNAFD